MENLTNTPEYSDTKRSSLSSPSNLKAIDSPDNIPSPISNFLNDENVQQIPLVSSCISNPKSELSNHTENTTISTAELTTHLEKDLHPPKERNERTPNPSPNPSPRNHNSTTPNLAEPNSESESQTPSEHSSGSDAAFYCSVGSPSEDEEDGSGASLVLMAEEEEEEESSLKKRALREVVSTSEAGVSADSGGTGEYDDNEEEGEERNEIYNNNSKRRKLNKRFTFLKRLSGRKKSRDRDGSASASAGGVS